MSLVLFSCEKINSVSAIFTSNTSLARDTINLTEIDQYPQFKECDALLDFEKSKTCFEKHMYQQINTGIQQLQLKTKTNFSDTLLVKFSINTHGAFLCKNIQLKDSTQILFPNLSKDIAQIIQTIPTVLPAQKRGIPVTSSYTIPILIQTK
ncbi:hypothetical protein [Ochrovirga pacifica]|uniref:hypothetical protein n=1 Tax=Ochrovirga pacifica TaxID=1042376 RepID=UPI0005240CF7|nr:hypothetical protein [Ochrovirga pacifica]